MQDFFGQPPAGPLQDPLEDPFEAMLNALEQDITGCTHPFDREEYLYMDSLGELLRDAEVSIENSQPIPPALGMEQDITNINEGTVAPDNPLSTSYEGFADSAWAYSSPQPESPNARPAVDRAAAGAPPLPYYIEAPQRLTRSHLPPPSAPQRGGRGAGIRSSSEHREERYCVMEGGWVLQETCTENCEYYDQDAGLCRYDNGEES